MKCGIHGNWKDVQPEEVKGMAEKTTVRWLIKDAPNFQMRLFEVEKGGRIYPHSHPWEHEIFILSGRGKIRIGCETIEVKEGDFLLIPPNVEHEYWNTGEGVLRFLCLIPKNK